MQLPLIQAVQEVTETSDLVCILYSVSIKEVNYYTNSVLYEVAADSVNASER